MENQVSGVRCQVSGVRCQGLGVRWETSRTRLGEGKDRSQVRSTDSDRVHRTPEIGEPEVSRLSEIQGELYGSVDQLHL